MGRNNHLIGSIFPSNFQFHHNLHRKGFKKYRFLRLIELERSIIEGKKH